MRPEEGGQTGAAVDVCWASFRDVDRSKGDCNCVLVCRNVGGTSRWESCYRAGMMMREKFGGIVWRPECMNDVMKGSDG
jgi:hypothetical protein